MRDERQQYSLEHIALTKGDALVFWLPDGFSNDLRDLTKYAAMDVAKARPDVVVLMLPESIRLTKMPSPELRALARQVIDATEP